MSINQNSHYLFTSESVSPGHPDKCADIISDSVLDAYLAKDSNSRVAVETLVAGKHIVLGGEVRSSCTFTQSDYEKIVKDALSDIGYSNDKYFTKDECLHIDDIQLQVNINQQSDEIYQGVDQQDGNIGAGDQGIMFGFANNECDNYMPIALNLARELMNAVYQYALKNPHEFGVDIKTQITIDYKTKDNYENCNPQSIHTIVCSAPCVRGMDIKTAREKIQKIIDSTFGANKLYDKDKVMLYINPTGKYVNHSSLHDSGLTGRKLIVDSFGGYSPIGGGAQSGKDYTKVDRSALYKARYIAKHIVASGLSKKAIVQISYAIGIAKPLSVNVDTSGTYKEGLSDDIISRFVEENFDLSPKAIIDKFKLDKPSSSHFMYADVAKNGQVGYEQTPWEKLDSLEIFKKLI